MAVVRSCCPLDCPDRCSLEVVVDADRVVSIDGSDANPLTEGYICGKVRNFAKNRVYGKHRILSPGQRVGPRGPGATFRPMPWDEAIDIVAERFARIAAEDGWEAVWPYWYGGSNGWLTGGGLDVRLWNRLGTSRCGRTLCANNTAAGTRAVYGDLPSADPLDVDHAQGIVIWGFNPSASGIHWVPRVRDAQARGASLVVVDPRRIPLAKGADQHLAPLPGTDVVLALSVAQVAFAEDLADLGFLQRWCAGLEAYRAAAESWPPERAAEICGVRADEIRRFARWYAANPKVLLRAGWGLERTANGSDAVRAVLSLPAVFGRFGERGAGWVLSTSGGYGIDSKTWQQIPGSPAVPPRTLNMSRLGRILEETRDPPIRALYVYDCNPVATAPDQGRILSALADPDRFVVVHEQVYTDTTAYADIVLPATTFLEHRELVRSYGGHVVQRTEAVIPPLGEARSNHEVMAHLARALGLGDEPGLAISEVALVDEMVRAAGLPADTLAETGIAVLPRPVQFVDVMPTAPVQLAGPLGPPRYRPPTFAAERSLTLVSPATTRAISSTGYETLPIGTAKVGLCPADAAQRGISDGDRVRVFNHQGEVILIATVDPTLRGGVAMIPKGLWRSGTINGLTANVLIPDHVDEHGLGACYNDARVDIERVDPGAP